MVLSINLIQNIKFLRWCGSKYIYIKVKQSRYKPGVAGPEGFRKLRFQDIVTTVQHGGRLSALRTGPLYPQEILLVLISVRG